MKRVFRSFAHKAEMTARILAGHVLKYLYANDVREAERLNRQHWFPEPLSAEKALAAWEVLKKRCPGLDCGNYLRHLRDVQSVPFVYGDPESPQLRKLRETFAFESLIASAPGEYEAMLALGTWLGSRWDHGKDSLPGSRTDIDAVRIIEAGMQGGKYWCEIAAKVAVQAFTSMGWPARLATGSSDGYTWEHAVAEIWSNQFSKWFAMDTDFNVVYEAEGVPLSIYELCHTGPALQREGKLHRRMLGGVKPSLPLTDLLYFYAYAHIDMRSDWNTRKLRWGSPAGGDLATWWTARSDFRKVLTPKIRVDAREMFDWSVNIAWVCLEDVRPAPAGYAVKARLYAFAPYFGGFQISLDGQPWTDAPTDLDLVLNEGNHVLSARVVSRNGRTGSANSVRLHLPVSIAAPLAVAQSRLKA